MSELRESLWDSRRYPLLYFAIAYALGVSASLAANVLPAYPYVAWFVGLGPCALVLILIYFRRLFPPERVTFESELLAQARPARGLVVFASPGEGIKTAEAAIRYHKSSRPDLRVWLFHSDTSLEHAVGLKGAMLREGMLTDDKLTLHGMSDADFINPERVREDIEQKVFQSLDSSMGQQDVIIDLTGGRKTTTAGAFLAALPLGRRMEVVNPRSTDSNVRGTEPGDPMEIVLEYRIKRVAIGKGKKRR